MFEFDPAKNGGVHRFKVDCSYKPGQPYIHVAPDWGGLYGTNINDARGLICGGDFSLPTATNRWLNFELNNKNYQQQFDREIENMEHERSIQKKEQIVQTVTGAVSGAGTGAAMGAMVGGGIGAAVGATLGAGMSIAGGIADLKHAEARFDEAMDYKKDMFGFQLGNIQALPHSLSKVSAYNNNNKIYPFIEKYHATEQEEQALREKIKYNGMTVGRIDKIENFLGIIPNQLSYIKGRPIELNIPEDAHLLTELIIEVNKGIRA